MLLRKGNVRLAHNIFANRELVNDLVHTKGKNIWDGVEGLRRD